MIKFRHKKLMLTGLLAVLAVGILTGCHGKKESSAFAIPETFDEAQKVEITFWAKNDTNKNQTAVYKQAIEDFEKIYPNVTVSMKLYTDYNKIYNDVITNMQTDTTPNVCITYPDHIATYLEGENTVVPLDDLMTDDNFGLGGSEVKFDAPTSEEMIPEYLEECKLNGSTYAVPFMRSSEACYVNKDFVEKLGYELPEVLTWDFIWEVSEAATEKNDDGTYKLNGQKVLIPFIYKSTDNMMIQYLHQMEAGYSTETGEIGIFNDTTAEMLQTCAEHAKTGAFSTFKISSYPANFLNAGQCIFAVDSTAGSTWMGTDAPLTDIAKDKIVKFDTAVLPVPQVDPENPQMISQGPSICVFNKADSQVVLASWLFTQYLLTNDIQNGYAQTEGYVPVTSKARESAEYQDYLSKGGKDNKTHYQVKIDATKMVIDNTENTFTTPVFNGSASLRLAAGGLIEDVTKAARRKKTIDDAYLEKLYGSITSLYHLDQIEAQSAAASGNADLGPLPGTAKALLGALAAAWVLIAVWYITRKIRKAQA